MAELFDKIERKYIGTLLNQSERDTLYDLGFLDHDEEKRDDYISEGTLSTNVHILVFLEKLRKNQSEIMKLQNENLKLRRKTEKQAEILKDLKDPLSKLVENERERKELLNKILQIIGY
ncbi:MAG: hypothetical protein P8Y97_07830 [Candidatus Lokiarchaeota archaeon]